MGIEVINSDKVIEQLDLIVSKLSDIENAIIRLKELGVTLNI